MKKFEVTWIEKHSTEVEASSPGMAEQKALYGDCTRRREMVTVECVKANELVEKVCTKEQLERLALIIEKVVYHEKENLVLNLSKEDIEFLDTLPLVQSTSTK